jgi:nucleoside-diphosphate-sugar epimerase
MRAFVAGGTGVMGRRLVPQLVARGHQVTCLHPEVVAQGGPRAHWHSRVNGTGVASS